MIVPADVPTTHEQIFIENYTNLTKGTDRLMLFTADQKIEHLNPLSPDDLFVIASTSPIGGFATHPGFIARYGKQYSNINYVAKLNGKTNLVPQAQKDPLSYALWNVEQMVKLRDAGIKIAGIGYTIYPGSEYESEMFRQAAEIVFQAHQNGFVAFLWSYPRGKAVRDDVEEHIIAGAAGVSAALGADFVKVKIPRNPQTQTCGELLRLAVHSAGNTKVICSGGERQEPAAFINEVHDLLTVGKSAGCAVGRNIYQHNFSQAMRMAEAISKMVYNNCSKEEALAHIKTVK